MKSVPSLNCSLVPRVTPLLACVWVGLRELGFEARQNFAAIQHILKISGYKGTLPQLPAQ